MSSYGTGCPANDLFVGYSFHFLTRCVCTITHRLTVLSLFGGRVAFVLTQN